VSRLRPVAVVLAAALLAAACSVGGGSGGTGGEIDANPWALTAQLVDGTSQPVPSEVTVDATFDTATSTVSGSSGCNLYTGPFTLDGGSLTIGPVAGTMRACEAPAGTVEGAYLANLDLVRTYTATADRLELFDGGGTTILEFAVAETAELAGPIWRATGINNGTGGVVSIAAGTEPTAQFDEAGTISGNASCNQFNGPAVVDGQAIAIGPLISTRMACVDEAASTQETAYLAALEASTTYELSPTGLELRDASGATMVTYEAD
jgi:heat shock protein HslJ